VPPFGVVAQRSTTACRALVRSLQYRDKAIHREYSLSIDVGAPGRLTPSFTSNAARLLWDSAARHGDRPAVVERGSTVTYTALRDRAAAIGATLCAAGVGADDRVAILLERGRDAAAAFFATLAAGAIAVVVNETLRPRQIEHVLEHSGARCLITAADMLARQPRRLSTAAGILDASGIRPGGEPLAPLPRLGGNVAQIVYTSGSTGLPKGVVVSHANLWALTSAVVSYLGVTDADRLASLLPFSFVYGVGQLLCAVSAGAALVVERSPLPQQMVETVRTEGVTVLAAVPPLWNRLLRVPAFIESPLPALRVMTNAGGHLPVGAVRALRRAQPGAQLYLMYGLTEALRCTYLPPEEVDRRPDSMGRAIPGGEVYVVREDGTPAPPGEVGELVYRGPTVTLGYWNDPTLSAQVFRPNSLRPSGDPPTDAERVVFSGDLVRRDDEGFLYFVGRRDRIIKTMGYRVGPDEILSVLYASGEVADAVVVGEPDEERGECIVAYVVLAEQGSLERLQAYYGRELPRYFQPARVELRDALPVLASGKHDLQAMRAGPGTPLASQAE
jgi:amino acid adenylation domain-containing protein